jgi:DNA-binding HxlR family transcriptional regulator
MPRRSTCPINAALELLGDRWSLLVVRDLMFIGRRTYQQFRQAPEGIATNILASRLKRLEVAGLIERRADPLDARRVHYDLTEKGIDLAPALVALIRWGLRHESGTKVPPAILRHLDRDPDILSVKLRRRWLSQRLSSAQGG